MNIKECLTFLFVNIVVSQDHRKLRKGKYQTKLFQVSSFSSKQLLCIECFQQHLCFPHWIFTWTPPMCAFRSPANCVLNGHGLHIIEHIWCTQHWQHSNWIEKIIISTIYRKIKINVFVLLDLHEHLWCCFPLLHQVLSYWISITIYLLNYTMQTLQTYCKKTS